MKEDELSVAKQAYEELKSNLKDKETAIKFLSSANGRLRADYDSKLKKFEEENRSMAVALDETNAANMEQEQKETSLVLLVLRSHLSEVHQKLGANSYTATDLTNKEEQNISIAKQLDQTNSDLVRAEKDLEDEREKVAILLSRVESLNWVEEQQLPLRIEVDILKEMLKEASTYQAHLKEEVLKTKSESKVTLDRANEELAESFYEGKVIESELQIWRFVAERLQSSLNEDMELTNELGRIMQTCGGFGLDMKRVNKFFDPAKENLNICC
nr:putative centromere protein [Ipomoea batatas]